MDAINADKLSFAKFEGKRPHEKLTYRWESNTGTVDKNREC